MITQIQVRDETPYIKAVPIPKLAIGDVQLMVGSAALFLSFAEAALIVEALQHIVSPEVTG